MDPRTARRTRYVVTGAAVVATAGALVYPGVGAGADGAGSLAGDVLLVLLVTAFWSLPFVLYTFLTRSTVATLLLGAVLLALLVAGLSSILTSENSTAGIGYITIPPLLLAVAGAGILVDRVATGVANRRRAA